MGVGGGGVVVFYGVPMGFYTFYLKRRKGRGEGEGGVW